MRDSYQQNPRLLGVLPNDDILSQCIHCGMCLAVCPTYDMTKNERSSPRGRIKLIKSVARGEMKITPTFAEEMKFIIQNIDHLFINSLKGFYLRQLLVQKQN